MSFLKIKQQFNSNKLYNENNNNNNNNNESKYLNNLFICLLIERKPAFVRGVKKKITHK